MFGENLTAPGVHVFELVVGDNTSHNDGGGAPNKKSELDTCEVRMHV